MEKADIVASIMERNQLLDRLQALPQITITAMNDPAHGSGFEMSLACDIRYVSSATTIAFPEADMGGSLAQARRCGSHRRSVHPARSK